MAEPISIRESALAALEAYFSAQTKGQPASDPYDFTWDLVQRQPLGDLGTRQGFALAILDTDELKPLGFGWAQPVLNVTLEFMALVDPDSNPSTVGNCVLANIQRRLRADRRLASQNNGVALVIDMTENGNALEIEDYADRQIRGQVFIEVRYKHALNDPRVVVGSL